MFRLMVIALLGGNPVHIWVVGRVFDAQLTCETMKDYYEDEISRRVNQALKTPVETETRCVKIGDQS